MVEFSRDDNGGGGNRRGGSGSGGGHSIFSALNEFIQPEMLAEDNQYRHDIYGKIDAQKGLRFQKFPPILFVILKRYTFSIRLGEWCMIDDLALTT